MISLRNELKKVASTERAKALQRFFKTGKGEYGEGDIFLGLTVPQIREIAKKFNNLNLSQIKQHLKSKYHEERLAALLILVNKYDKEIKERKKIFDFYLNNTKHVNNWDLVDLSAHKIVGRFLYGWDFDEYYAILANLAKSSNLWERRISIIATFYFINNNEFQGSIRLAELFLSDKHDLIHKAVGWMMREIGNRDLKVEESFLKKHYKKMPRTMLRYAIEKFPENRRKKYLKGLI